MAKKKLENINFDIQLQPVQHKLWDIYDEGEATRVGLGGSRGGAKSHTSDSVMIMRRYKYPGTNGLFVMKVYQDMVDIHLTPMFEFYPGLEKYFNKQYMILKLPNSGGSYIRFLSGDSLKEFQKRKGRGFADIMVDQSELFTQEEIEFLFTINRSTNPIITPKTLLCFNPGNIGHTYHKRVFYDKIYEKNEEAKDFVFLQTFGWDNAYWCIKSLAADGLTMDDFHSWDSDTRFNYYITRSEYGKNMNQLPDSKRKAELLGDMEIFEGMFFSDFRYAHHVIKNYKFQKKFNTVGGLDYGRVSCLEILQCDYEGTIAVFGECYLPDLESPSERANAIADYLLEKQLYNLHIVYDTDMDISQISNVGFDKKPIDIFRQVFTERMGEKAPFMFVVNKSSLDQHKGYRAVVNEAVKEYLHIDPKTKKSRLYFSDEVKHLIKCISELIHDTKDKNGLDFDRSMTPKTDHPYDGFKYAFMQLYQSIKPKVSDLPSWAEEEGFNEEDEDTSRLPHSVMGI